MEKIKLLGVDSNAKTVKGQKKGYMTAILYLAPSDLSGVTNVCPFASAGCRAACLYDSGHAAMDRKDGSNPVKAARIKRTKFYHENRKEFIAQLKTEIEKFVKRANKKNLIPAVRLNGTSDLPFENMGIMQEFPDVIFYDYTKIPQRALKWAAGKMPPNYHITFSRSEELKNHIAAAQIAKAGGNIAVVFSDKNYPDNYMGLPVINGDENDLRFLDPKGSVVALYAKNKARKDTSGFVVPTMGGDKA